jgi:AcrR family transcriptional regulator
MDMKLRLVQAALAVLERDGEQGFSTRAVCALAEVTAPTLYHHFGAADGLLSAAIEQAFAEFLGRKQSAPPANDEVRGLVEGWNDYVAFAAERPRLYAIMIARLLQGADIPAATQARAMLLRRLEAIEREGRLRLAPGDSVDLVWASAHAAAMLWVTARRDPPSAKVIDALREAALRSLIDPEI